MANSHNPYSLFATAPDISVGLQDSSIPSIIVHAEPTKSYGVGLVRVELGSASCTSKPPTGQHMIWLHRSGIVPVTVRLAGRRYDCAADLGSSFIYPAEADATCEASGPGQGWNLRVSAECIALAGLQLASGSGSLLPSVNSRDATLFRFGQMLEAEAAAGHPNGVLYWSSIADALIRHLSSYHFSTTSIPSRGTFTQVSIKRLGAYILDNLNEPLDLHTLASIIGCDRFHFAHRFRETTGISPHRYVMRLRLHYARERIRNTRVSLAQVAHESGFADQSHLCRWSQRIYNLRPSEWRP